MSSPGSGFVGALTTLRRWGTKESLPICPSFTLTPHFSPLILSSGVLAAIEDQKDVRVGGYTNPTPANESIRNHPSRPNPNYGVCWTWRPDIQPGNGVDATQLTASFSRSPWCSRKGLPCWYAPVSPLRLPDCVRGYKSAKRSHKTIRYLTSLP